MDIHEEVLVSIRQIIRAIDLRSKKLNKDFGLTSPQLLLMRAIKQSPKLTIRQLSKETNMSQATATSILDRLEKRGFITRQRDTVDKRKVHAVITEPGETILNKAPQLLHDDFINKFQSLPKWEQTLLLSSLQRLSSMMNAPEVSHENLILTLPPDHLDDPH
ncbi:MULTISPECIES: MarR family winged helix-turn-helix transcriptional regulator [Vibrio]|uniref:MarR family transcriptional regulator n=2 Tax=Vibrio TaxID=662 RepID=A0A7X4LPP9_9VIBR|nr:MULTISPECIES: MarR family transcriptional regulator [Vibrio]MBF9002807.1 MarR family transcriptional regulator [Vibrio nitrifigilis]MBF9003624.1 MarR family transcriptional regulator [Vibrio nitrifigilis]MZI95849.1 MarR family transcriptional regulator [Vibrio eleionomae]